VLCPFCYCRAVFSFFSFFSSRRARSTLTLALGMWFSCWGGKRARASAPLFSHMSRFNTCSLCRNAASSLFCGGKCKSIVVLACGACEGDEGERERVWVESRTSKLWSASGQNARAGDSGSTLLPECDVLASLSLTLSGVRLYVASLWHACGRARKRRRDPG